MTKRRTQMEKEMAAVLRFIDKWHDCPTVFGWHDEIKPRVRAVMEKYRHADGEIGSGSDD